jgi:hypothetical protein
MSTSPGGWFILPDKKFPGLGRGPTTVTTAEANAVLDFSETQVVRGANRAITSKCSNVSARQNRS